MRRNNVEESTYVGWGVRRQTRLLVNKAADLFAWENVDGSRRVKKISFNIVKETFCNFTFRSPIICTIFDNENENLSEVSSTIST